MPLVYFNTMVTNFAANPGTRLVGAMEIAEQRRKRAAKAAQAAKPSAPMPTPGVDREKGLQAVAALKSKLTG